MNMINTMIKTMSVAIVCALLSCGCKNVVTVKSGSLAALKGATVVNLEYDYAGMKVGNQTDEEYARVRVEKRNQQTAGAGDDWLSRWQGNRAGRYQPKFEQLLNKQFTARNVDLNFGQHPEAKYTLVLKSICIKPGSYWHRYGLLDADAIIVATQNRENQVAVVTCRKMVGADPYAGLTNFGPGLEQGFRIQESYAKTGKELGALIANQVR